MWTLENDGDVFHHKRLWLRPGKTYVFGRTQQSEGGGGFVISDKTISRQHLIVKVDDSPVNECPNLESRSRVTLTDPGTKIGTLVNEKQIKGESFTLPQDENIVTLGRHKYAFHFTWVPVTLTFSFPTKEEKADPWKILYQRLGPLDIKVSKKYHVGVTTHLAASKRNTSKGLQALIDGKYIVHADSYVNALEIATIPDNDDFSPLEKDFEGNFPDPLDHLPPRGEEPTQRDSSAYAPLASRRNMFEGYKFIFYEERQYLNLYAPIEEGGGKVLLEVAKPNQTQVDDFVRYVKTVAGDTGLGEFEDGSVGKGVVVVRFNPVKGAGTDWFAEFGREVSLRLGQRLIEQNEFLDAILGSDASVLRRPLEVEMSGISTLPPPDASFKFAEILPVSQPASGPTSLLEANAEPIRRGRSRRLPVQRFKGFDDDDDEEFGTAAAPLQDSMMIESIAAGQSQSQGLFVTQDPDIETTLESSSPAEPRFHTSRKRPPIVEEIDIMQTMAPAAHAVKKRRIAEEAARKERGEQDPPPVAPKHKEPVKDQEQPVINKKKRKTAMPDIDVIAVAREQREKAEALAREEREALIRDLDGMDIEAIRDLVVVEEMEVRRSQPLPRNAARADESGRWDDKWNGRKNFKKFRRRGAEDVGNRRKIIVELEEVKKKSQGIGDEYWLGSDKNSQRKRKGKGNETQDPFTPQLGAELSGKSRPESHATRREATSEDDTRPKEFQSISSDDSEDLPAVFPKAAGRSQNLSTVTDKTNTTKNKPATTLKRPAAVPLTRAAPAKKPRQTLIREESSDDSDDDGLRFRFKPT